MTVEADFELVKGTGNVFQDLGDPDAALKQTKALLAADIISALDNSGLSVRKAGEATGFAAADFSRIRNANLGRFTVDRLMRILSALDRASASPTLGRRSAALPTLEPSHAVPKPIIVDKSYAQGARSLSSFQRSWCLLFPDAFFFEVASTDPQARERCLAKLREVHGHGGLRVAPNVGELLRKEIHDLNKAGPPSDNLIDGLDLDAFFSIRFDNLSKARREALQSTEADFGQDIDGLITRTQMLQRCFPSTCEGTTANRRKAFRASSRNLSAKVPIRRPALRSLPESLVTARWVRSGRSTVGCRCSFSTAWSGWRSTPSWLQTRLCQSSARGSSMTSLIWSMSFLVSSKAPSPRRTKGWPPCSCCYDPMESSCRPRRLPEASTLHTATLRCGFAAAFQRSMP